MRAWSLLVLLLAGCSQGPAADGDDRMAQGEANVIAAPVWSIGDWWTYDNDGDVTWVVTEDRGSSWLLDVDDPGWAFFHQAFEQISTVGEVSKAHLAGSQEAGPVDFFRFPLEENKTWPMTWDGTQFTATVVDIADGTAEVRAEADDGSVRVYIYDAQVRWFRSISAYHANGTQEFAATIEDHGTGYDGVYSRWTLHAAYERQIGVGEQAIETFHVPEDATDIWYRYHIHCSPEGLEGDGGAFVFEAHPGDGGDGISETGMCPVTVMAEGTLDPVPGEWGVTMASAGATMEVTYWPRTLQELRLT